MINREDMLELTRRMTPARTSFVRMAGCYTDSDGEYDGSFNIHFLKLSGSEKTRNLAIAKKIPFAESNEKLREYRFPEETQGAGSIWQMLMALRECGLKNDALLETFYDILIEGLQIHGAYAIYMFYDRYDIPAKTSDKERLGESEEMFPYLICAVCPLVVLAGQELHGKHPLAGGEGYFVCRIVQIVLGKDPVHGTAELRLADALHIVAVNKPQAGERCNAHILAQIR